MFDRRCVASGALVAAALLAAAARAAGDCRVAKLTAEDGVAGGAFGWAVSIQGARAVVGARHDDDLGEGAGAAYVYRQEQADWLLEAKLAASDGEAGDFFGFAVCLDGGRIVIGAWGDGQNGSWHTGAAYVFRDQGGTWVQEAKLTSSAAADGDEFGFSVALSGNWCFVGALGDDAAGFDSGAVYVFRRQASAWIEHAQLVPHDLVSADQLGWTVAADGDYALFGVNGDDDLGANSGSAYVYRRDDAGTPDDLSDDNWVEQGKLTAGDGAAGDRFGWSVGLQGRFAVVGAPCDQDAGACSGSVYVFQRRPWGWVQAAKLSAADAGQGDRFGGAVSIEGPFLVAGAQGEDHIGSASGAAYVFERELASGRWSQLAKLTARDGAAGDRFGNAVAVGGVYALVGSYMSDDPQPDAGAAYIYFVPDCGFSAGGLDVGRRVRPLRVLPRHWP